MPKPIKKPVWNNVDAIGLINGISIWDDQYQNLKYVRLPDESNIELRHKINNFRDNPIDGSIDQQLITGLANEFNLMSYDILNVSTFNLTRLPHPQGQQGDQDVFVSYQIPNTTGWITMTPQWWSEDLESMTPTSGFTIWEDGYYTHNDLNSKSNMYSRILQVFEPLPDLTKLKIVYSIKQYDERDNFSYINYTDMSNPYNVNDTSFIYRKGYDITEPDLSGMASAYSLSNIPDNFYHNYFDDDGKGTDKLYEIRDKIDKLYRQRWHQIEDRKTIWDINLNYSSGTIPSFYDVEFNTTIDEYDSFVTNLTGGVNYYNTALYVKDVDIVIDDETDEEHWYPVLQPGPLYVNGAKHYLMENPQSATIDLTYGSGVLPSGVKIQHHTILETAVVDQPEYIYTDYDYSVAYSGGIHNPNQTIARYRPYLTSEKGFEIILQPNEYSIDYDNDLIYSNGLNSCVLYWDEVDVPDRVTIATTGTDLNPINDTELGYDSYFITASNH